MGLWAKFKNHIVTGVAGLVLAAVSADGIAGYEWGNNLAQRQWVIDHVQHAMNAVERRKRVREQIRALSGRQGKAQDAEVIEGLDLRSQS